MKLNYSQLRRLVKEEISLFNFERLIESPTIRRRFGLKDIIFEMSFYDSPDEDKPGNNQFIVFSPDETYDVEGATHGEMSHMIKHYLEFEKANVEKGLQNAINAIKSDSKDIILKNAKSGAEIAKGDAAVKQLTTGAMLNTFDLINDKIKTGKKLNDAEEKIKPFIEELTNAYSDLIQSYLDAAKDTKEMTAEEIKSIADSGGIIKFIGKYHGNSVEYALNFSNTGLVANKGGVISTCFRIDKKGNDLSKVTKYFSGNVEIENSELAKFLGLENKQSEKEEKALSNKQESFNRSNDLLLERWNKLAGLK